MDGCGFEDESLEDCEANGDVDPKMGGYTGWPADCEGVFFPALPYRFDTEAACVALAQEYRLKTWDFFRCSLTRPGR